VRFEDRPEALSGSRDISGQCAATRLTRLRSRRTRPAQFFRCASLFLCFFTPFARMITKVIELLILLYTIG
jgi:hypothetical protein